MKLINQILRGVVIGIAIGIVALASLLSFLFERYPLPTNTAFIGLILGGLAPLLRKIERKKINPVAVIVFIVFFAVVIWMALAGQRQNAESVEINIGTILILVVMGAIASATMIIPGVSGSMMLMLLGYYTPVLNALNTLKTAIFSANLAAMGAPLAVLLPFVVGVALGIFGIAKLIEWFIARFPTPTYCGVLGLVLASPVAILIRTNMTGVSVWTVGAAVATFVIGFIAARLLEKGSAKS